MTELLFFTTISFGLTYEAIGITGYYFTQSWIKINHPTQGSPQTGLSTAVIIGIVFGSLVVIAIAVIITVHQMRNGQNESETSDDISDLRGEAQMTKEPGLLYEDEP
jgi:hypothetical protein